MPYLPLQSVRNGPHYDPNILTPQYLQLVGLHPLKLATLPENITHVYHISLLLIHISVLNNSANANISTSILSFIQQKILACLD